MSNKLFFFTKLNFLLLGCYAAAVSAAPNPATKDYVNSTLLGRQAQGGVVFFTYLSGNVVHGLVAAAADEPGTYSQPAAINQCLNKTANGYSDWVLPNKAQLTALFNNRYIMNPDDANGGFFGFYWTSTTNNIGSWVQNFNAGTQQPQPIFSLSQVRCIRII